MREKINEKIDPWFVPGLINLKKKIPKLSSQSLPIPTLFQDVKFFILSWLNGSNLKFVSPPNLFGDLEVSIVGSCPRSPGPNSCNLQIFSKEPAALEFAVLVNSDKVCWKNNRSYVAITVLLIKIVLFPCYLGAVNFEAIGRS